MSSYPTDAPFNVKEYIDACNESSKRTRAVIIILVVACVLVAIGFYNSRHNAWMLQRIRATYDSKSDYIAKKLGWPDTSTLTDEEKEAAREKVQESFVKAYVDNTYFIKLPFFGIAFDINDMGLIGGVGLICILILLTFSLSRERKILRFSFKEAINHKKIYPFYYHLAMHQGFTIPAMRDENINSRLVFAFKSIYLLPPGVFLCAFVYDSYTVFILKLFSFENNWPLLSIELLFLLIINANQELNRSRQQQTVSLP